MSSLTQDLTKALREAAKVEILRNPVSAAQFKKLPVEHQERLMSGYSAWVLPTIIPIIAAYLPTPVSKDVSGT